MSRRRAWALLGLALFTLLTISLQLAGAALLTAHLTAAAAAVGIVAVLRLAARSRSAAHHRHRG